MFLRQYKKENNIENISADFKLIFVVLFHGLILYRQYLSVEKKIEKCELFLFTSVHSTMFTLQ